jgi:hypothetical protein
VFTSHTNEILKVHIFFLFGCRRLLDACWGSCRPIENVEAYFFLKPKW